LPQLATVRRQGFQVNNETGAASTYIRVVVVEPLLAYTDIGHIVTGLGGESLVLDGGHQLVHLWWTLHKIMLVSVMVTGKHWLHIYSVVLSSVIE